MSDDFSTRRGTKADRRRRTTRRLMKHAARALGDAALSVKPEAASPEDEPDSAAQPEAQSELAVEVDESPFDSEGLDGPPPPSDSEPPVEWSAEESPLMAALSAAAEAGKAGWDVGDEPDTATHTSSPPPALVNDVVSGLVAVAGEAAAKNDANPQPMAADAATSEPSSEFGNDEPTEPGAPVLPGAALETEASAVAAGSPTHDAWGEIAESDRPAAAARGEEPEQEVKTKPKIRLPEGAARRPSPRSPTAAPPPAPEVALGRIGASPLPPMPVAPTGRPGSPLPPVPVAAGRSSRNPPAPTGEGIIRASQPPRPSPGFGRPDLDSDVPTRPRIPLTHDMALAAGRVSALGVQRMAASDADDTRPRILVSDGDGAEAAPAVVVTRSRVISDRPSIPYDAAAESGKSDATEPARVAEAADSYTQEPLDESEDVVMGDELDPAPEDVPPPRPSRRSRPDSEEFETLDLEESEEQPSRLEISAGNGELRGNEIGARVSRTPPPPPAQPGKRGPSPAAQQRAAPPPPPPGAAKKPAAAQKAKDTDKEKEKDKTRTKRRAWWEVLFSDDYVRTLPRPSQALVAKQVGFMESSLGISRGDAVLDVGCGLGQHALEFARRGYLVVALDLALSMITRAAEEAQQHGLRINFLHKDIRDIGFEGTFDAILCVGTTFGFFDDEQNRGVLQRLAHALKPGGRLLLEVVNRDYVIGSQPNLVWFEGDGCVVMEESDFNFYSSRLNVKRTMMREDGRQTESEYSVRLYSVHELGQLLKQAGFGIKEVSGQEATRGLFFGSQSSRIIMLAERRTPGRSRPDSSPPASE